MGQPLALNNATQPLPFLMVLSSDHITGATGKTCTVTICKSGGTFAAPVGTVSEISNGWYELAANAIDANTLGPLLLHATAPSCDPRDSEFSVVNYNPSLVSVSSPPGAPGSTRILGLCQDAATELGIYAAGESLSSDDAALWLALFRRLINLWNTDRRAVYATSFLTFTISPPSNPLTPITIGPTGNWVTDSRPVSVDGANLILTTSTPNVQLPIRVRDHQWWLSQNVPTLTSTIPTDLYYQPDWPNGSCYFWPVPTVAYKVELMVRVLLTEAVSLVSTFTLPPGYQQAMTLTLAEMGMRAFGITPEQVPTLRGDASQARALIFGNNDQIPYLHTRDAGMTPGSGGHRADFNWLNGQIV